MILNVCRNGTSHKDFYKSSANNNVTFYIKPPKKLSGISVKADFLFIGVKFLSLALVQESRKGKLIASRKRNWPVQIHCLAAMKYGVKGSISQRLNIPSV